MPRRRNRRELGFSAEINVTSLVDVVLTLLVIFMITAPMMQGGVEVKVPRARTESVPSAEGLVVSIDRTGQIFVGSARVGYEQFETLFPQLVREKGANSVDLRADEGVPYGTVVRVLGVMRASGVGDVGLVAEPEAQP